MWRRGRRDPAAWSAAGRRGGGGSRRPPRPGAALRTRRLARASSRGAESPVRPPPPAPRAPGPGVRGGLLKGGRGKLVGRALGASQILCVPTPGLAGALSLSLSPPTPVAPLEGAGVRPRLHPNKRFGARRAPGRCEAAPSSSLSPFPEI